MIELYILLAISGGITSGIITFIPIVQKLKLKLKGKQVTNTFIEHPITSFITWCVLATILLPFITLSILSKKENDRFISTIVDKRA